MKTWSEIIERLIWKITSGRFIFTIVVGFVFAYLACTGILKEDRIMEVTLIVLYAYFSRPRLNEHVVSDEKDSDGTVSTTTSASK